MISRNLYISCEGFFVKEYKVNQNFNFVCVIIFYNFWKLNIMLQFYSQHEIETEEGIIDQNAYLETMIDCNTF